MSREEIENSLDEDDDILFMDGFDEAIVGLGTRFGITEPIVVYDKNKVIEILMNDMESEDEDDSYTMALEYFEYNIIGAWVGDRTPMFIEL